MKYKFIFAITALVFISSIAFSQTEASDNFDTIKVIKKGARLTEVSHQFMFTEGPAVDKQGNIFFTDQPNDKIWKFDVNRRLSLFMSKTGRSNGLYFDHTKLIACADEKNQLWEISANKKVSVILTDYEGQHFNGPNDLWIDAKGGIYFTDPYYQRDYWTRKKPEIQGQKVYYLPKGKKQPVIIDDTLVQPNGIVGTPDGQYLFVADIGAGKTYKYKIKKDGRLTDRQLFVTQGSDGMTLDNLGNLYITGKGVTIYDKTGKLIGHIPVPAEWVGNLCFGGKDRHTLFITASTAIYTIQMLSKGVE